MSIVRDNLLQRFTPEQQAELGAAQIDAALNNALLAYSEQQPAHKYRDLAVSESLQVTLPDDWVEGWSDVLSVDYSVLSGDDDIRVAMSFAVDDWALNAGQYELLLQHNLNNNQITVAFEDETGFKMFIDWMSVSADVIRVTVPYEPDGRINGLAIITRIL